MFPNNKDKQKKNKYSKDDSHKVVVTQSHDLPKRKKHHFDEKESEVRKTKQQKDAKLKEEDRNLRYMRSQLKQLSDERLNNPLVKEKIKKETKIRSKTFTSKYDLKEIDDELALYRTDDIDVKHLAKATVFQELYKDREIESLEANKGKAIALVKKEARDIAKTAINSVYKPIEKKKTQTLNEARILKRDGIFLEPEEKIVEVPRSEKQTEEYKYTREQLRELRKSKLRRKEYKKQKKKERREERKNSNLISLVTEAGPEEIKFDGLNFGIEDDANKTWHWFRDAPRTVLCGIISFADAGRRESSGFAEALQILHPIIIIIKANDRWSFNSGLNMFLKQLGGYHTFDQHLYALMMTIAYDKIIGIKKKTPTILTTEAGEPFDLDQIANYLDIGTDMLNFTMHGHLYKTLRNLLVSACALSVFNQDISDRITDFFGPVDKKDTSLMSLTTNVISSCSDLLRLAAKYKKGDNLMSILQGKDPFVENLNLLREVYNYRTSTYLGLPVEGKMDAKMWYCKARKALNYIEPKLHSFGPLTSQRMQLDTLINGVRQEMSYIHVKINQSQRQAPLVFVVTGPPGRGKSKILDFVFSQHSIALKRDFTSNLVYHRGAASKNWDGYDAEGLPYIHISEVGNYTPNYMASAGDPRLEEFLSVADSQPMMAPMAKLEDKGKTMIIPEAVGIDTNNPDMGLRHLFSNPAAFKRRFIEIECVVKEEYRKEGSGDIDPQKSNDDDGPYKFDRWWFTVKTFRPIDNTTWRTDIHFERGDCFKLADWIKRKTLSHVSNEAKIKAIMDDPKSYHGYQKDDDVKLDAEVGDDSLIENVAVPNSIFHVIKAAKSCCSDVWQGFHKIFEISGLACIYSALLMGEILRAKCMSLVYKQIQSILVILLLLCFPFISFTSFLWMLMIISVMHTVMPLLDSVHLSVYERAYSVKLRNKLEQLLVYIGWNDGYIYDMDIKHLILSTRLETWFKMLLIPACGYGLYSMLKKHPFEAQDTTEFKVNTKENESLNKVERELDCGRSYKRIPNKVITSWSNVMLLNSDNKHTSGLKELAQHVDKNVREIMFQDEISGSIWYTTGIGLKSNILMLNTHAFKGREQIKIHIGHAPKEVLHKQYYVMSPKEGVNRWDFGNDITFILTGPVQFRNITHHFFDGDKLSGSFPAYYKGTECVGIVEEKVSGLDNGKELVINDGVVWYKYANHQSGDCGTPLIGCVNKKSFIASIHIFGRKFSSDCVGILLTRRRIDSYLLSLNTTKSLKPLLDDIDVSAMLSRTDAEEDSPLTSEVGLTDPNEKSPLHYVKIDNMLYFGKLEGEVMLNNKSHLVPNIFAKREYGLATQMLKVYNYEPSTLFAPPVMKPKVTVDGVYVNPYNLMLEKANGARPSLDHEILRECIDVMKDHILMNLRNRVDISKIKPLTLDAAVNGVEEDAYLRRINMATSGGYDYPGTKKKHFIALDEKTYEPSEKLKRDVNRVFSHYKEGRATGFVFKASLKDEPRSLDKVRTGSTRVFFGSSLVNLVVSRMLLAPFFTLMVEHSDVFCCAIGIDMHRDAQRVVDILKWKDTIMAGDFSKYDLRIPFEILWAVSTLIYEVIENFGYTQAALEMVWGVLTDYILPFIAVNNDLFKTLGIQPSGGYATAERNCLINQMLMQYAWRYIFKRTLQQRVPDFYENNCLETFGDDLNNSVNPEYKTVFNDVVYAKFCKDHFWMEYTNTQKGSVVTPFVRFEEVVFLKRKFVYSEELSKYIAPLDMDSIFKTLMWRMPSDSISATEQVLAMTTSVLYELWFHSDLTQYEEMRTYFIDVICKHFDAIDRQYVEKSLPVYDFLTIQYSAPTDMVVSEEDLLDNKEDIEMVPENFCKNALLTEASHEVEPMSPNSLDQLWDNDPWSASLDALRNERMKLINERNNIHESKDEDKSNIEQRLYEIELTLEFIDRRIKKLLVGNTLSTEAGTDILEAHVNDDLIFKRLTTSEIEERLEMLYVRIERIDTFLHYIGRDDIQFVEYLTDYKGFLQECIDEMRWTLHTGDLVTESGDMIEAKSGVIDPNLIDRNETVRDVGGNDTTYVDEEIKQFHIMPETDVGLQDFLERPVQIVSTVIPVNTEFDAEYAVWDLWSKAPSVRAKLKNHAFISGDLELHISISGNQMHFGKLIFAYFPFHSLNLIYQQYIALGANGRFGFKQYMTQQTIKQVVDVKYNKPLVMTLPYISPSPMARLFLTSATTVVADTTSLPMISKLGAIRVKTLNMIGSASSGTITSVGLHIYALMKNVRLGVPTATLLTLTTESGDERQMGPLAKGTKSMAAIAGSLSAVPDISPYALASQMLFTRLHEIAVYMGWSKPSNINNPTAVKNEPFRNGANTVGMETNKKITLDPKQELAIHPYMHNMPDEMSYKFLCSREGLYKTLSWDIGDTPNSGTPIDAWGVSPVTTEPYYTSATKDYFQPSPMAMVAELHKFWQGKIKYRFEIVTSGFHRGKLAVIFEPNLRQSTLINSGLQLNKQYTFIVDIQETQDFEVCVDMAHAREWLAVCPRTSVNGVSSRKCNMTCLNWTSQPDYFNGYVSVWPITELQSPNNTGISINVYVSSDDMHFNQYATDSINTMPLQAEAGTEIDITCIDLNHSRGYDGNQSVRYFGEEPVSLRSILKRYVTVDRSSTSVDVTHRAIIDVNGDIYSRYTATPTASGTVVNALGYLRYAYLAMRGGMKFRWICHGLQAPEVTFIRASLNGLANTNTTSFSSSTANGGIAIADGTVTFHNHTNGGIEFEVPNYQPNLFCFANASTPWPDTDIMVDNVVRGYTVYASVTPNSTKTINRDLDRAIGEDFNLFHFMGAPPYTAY